MHDGLARAARIRRGYARATTYGTSMGGYGALLASRRLAADDVLAGSPQFSIDRAKVPFERRWSTRAARITFIDDAVNEELAPSARITFVHDPRSPDARHVAMVAPPDARHVALPHIGHGAIAFLAQGRLREPLLLAVAAGRDSALAGIHRKRRAFAVFWTALGDRAVISGRHRLAARCCWQSIAIAPTSYSAARKLGRCCQRLGPWALAAEWYDHAAGLRREASAISRTCPYRTAPAGGCRPVLTLTEYSWIARGRRARMTMPCAVAIEAEGHERCTPWGGQHGRSYSWRYHHHRRSRSLGSGRCHP